ncbi:hypothetical protein B7494_g2455 [Chlorociboria aeruginascens]|nr:hypothetical protein B7494_g2455 [Chlorociboria aeruginascens]
MDPLSVSTGIITFIGTAITTLSTSKVLINDVKDAFKKVLQLAREADELHKASLILAFEILNSSISLHSLEKVSGVSQPISITRIKNDDHFNALRMIAEQSATGVDSLVQSSSITREMLEDFQIAL